MVEVEAQTELVEPSCVVHVKSSVDEAYFLTKVAVEHPLYPQSQQVKSRSNVIGRSR